MHSLFPNTVLAVLALAVGGGCATLPTAIAKRETDRLLQAPLARASAADEAELGALLAMPLDATGAVRIALLRNPSVQSSYAQLGLAAADVFEASRLANPRLDLSVLWPRIDGEVRKVDGDATIGLTGLLTLPARRRAGNAQFSAAEQHAAAAVHGLALDVQAAWLDALAAQQRLAIRRNVADSAQLAGELAAKYHAAGNIEPLSLALQQAAASEAAIESSKAASAASRARAALRGLLGLREADPAIQLPDSLPAPTEASWDRAALLATAHAQRLDLAASTNQLRALEAQLSTARRFGFLGDADIGIAAEREGSQTTRRGARAGLMLPLFHQGQPGIARASAELDRQRAAHRELQVGIDAQVSSRIEQLAESQRQYATYREQLIPQREAAVQRLTEQANFMLAGPFELLLAKQQEYSAYDGAIDSLHDYWLNRIELARAVGAPLPLAAKENAP